MSYPEADLLRMVAKTQHDKTLLAVRDALDSLKTTEYNKSSYRDVARSAVTFKAEFISALRGLEIE